MDDYGKESLMKRILVTRLSLVILLFTTLVSLVLTASQGVRANPATRVSTMGQGGPTDKAEFEAFVDAYMKDAMAENHIPGVTFVMVKGGEIFLMKGYGFANLENQIPVDPQRHIFRVASISKLFVATAIMQLFEQGQIGLNDDVNKYLKAFQIPDNGLGPLTFPNLLTHSSGFEGTVESYTAQPSAYVPLETYISQRRPHRYALPGQTIQYSNLSYDLMGYLVQEITGQPFGLYVDQNIFKPLGMNRSSFEQVLPPQLTGDVAQQYEYANGDITPLARIYIGETPAGGLYTTAQDMAAFMIAHLQDGQYRDTQILKAATAQLMHEQHFSNYPRLDGFAYGFYVHTQNGQRLLLHGGDVQTVAAQLALLPEQQIGLFFTNNGKVSPFSDTNPVDWRVGFLDAFLDHYYPVNTPLVPLAPASNAASRVGRYAGNYRINTYNHTGATKFITFAPNQYTIASSGDRLTFGGPLGEPTDYIEIAPLLFQQADGSPNYLAFREDKNGRITHLFVEAVDAPFTFERIAWYETAYAILGILLFESVVFLSAILAWPIGALVRRWRKRAPEPVKTGWARWAAWLLSALGLFVLASWMVMFYNAWWRGADPLISNFVGLIVTLGAVHLAVLLALASLYFAWRAWREKYWGWLGRIHYTLVTLAGLVFIWLAIYWNWLGFRLY
jgi:CubicO group peptidase (beta-lactamase class C family)